MSIFFDEDTVLNPTNTRSFSTGERTGFMQNASKAFKAFQKSELFTSERKNLTEEYTNLVQLLHDNGHTDIFNPYDKEFNWQTGTGIDETDPDFGKGIDELQADFWNNVSERAKTDINLQTKLKEKGYSNQEEFQKTIGTKVQETWKDYYEINKRATTGGWWGGFAGMGAGAFTDPIMLATLPISFAYSVPGRLGAAAWKVAKIEGMLALAAESVIQTKVQPYRAEMGFEDAGFITGAKNVAFVTAGAATIAPVFMGLFKGVGYSYDGLRAKLATMSHEEIDKVYDDAIKLLPYHKKDNALSEIKAHKDDSPLIKKPNQDNEHNKRINTTIKNVLNDEPLEITDIPISPIRTELTNKEKNLVEFNVDEIEFDPKTFQYKSGGDEFGLTGKLKQVELWDQPSSGAVLVYEFKDGRKAIIDGHQRLGLAKKLKAQNPRLYGYLYREVDGMTPEYAMVMGMGANLRAGTGTAIDAAKVLRSKYGADVWQNISKSIPPQTKLVKEAAGLAKLSDDAFGMVVNGKVNQTLASRIGELIDDKSLHANILANVKGRSFSSIAEMDTFLRSVNQLPKTVSKQTTLFGEEFFASTLLVERSKILNIVAKNIKQDSAAFKSIIRNEEILQDAGNVIATDKNVSKDLLNEKILDRLEQVAIRQGELSDDLTKAAQLYRDGDKAAAIKNFREAIDTAVARGDFDGITTSRQLGANEVKTEIPGVSKDQKSLIEDLDNVSGFDKPGSKSVDTQARSLEVETFGEEIPKSIRVEAGATSAAKTAPAPKPLAKDQDLVSPSQKTDAEPPSEVLANAQTKPPLSRTDVNNSIGSRNSITGSKINQISNDFNEIVDYFKDKLAPIEQALKPIKDKYNGVYKARIKKLEKLQEKLKYKVRPDVLSDYVGARISVDTIQAAKMVANDVSKKFKVIHLDDFLDDIARTADDGNQYRAIHAQIMTKDGYTFELQIRLKDLDELTDQSHALRDNLFYKMDSLSVEQTEKMFAEYKAIHAKMKAKYFEIKDKELVSDQLIDEPITIGTRVDEATGEIMPVTKTAREMFEEEAKDQTMLARLKDCVT